MHLLVKPGPSDSSLASQRVALSSYAYLEGIAVEEYQGGGTAQDDAQAEAARSEIQLDGAAELAKEAKAKDPAYVPPPSNPNTMIAAMSALQTTDPDRAQTLATTGHHRAELVGGHHGSSSTPTARSSRTSPTRR